MRRLIPVGLILLVNVVTTWAQVTISAEDIPNDPGSLSYFYVEADTLTSDTLGIPVTITPPGANQLWDFRDGGITSITQDSTFNPQESVYADSFPTANRGLRSDVFFGLGFGSSRLERYEEVNEDGWNLVGVTLAVSMEALPEPYVVPFAFEDPIPIMPLPVEMGDEWEFTNTLETTYTDTSGLELLIRFEYGGFSNADADGTVQFEGGESECLRILTTFGGIIRAYPVIGGIPLPIPLYSQDIPVSKAYNFIAPGFGEIATIVSKPGEEADLFTEASSIRRRTLNPSSIHDMEETLPDFFTLLPAFPNPFNASTTVSFSLNKPEEVSIEVYNSVGRKVDMFGRGWYGAGVHHLAWQPSTDIASGLYFLHIEAGSTQGHQRLILLK